MGFLKCSFVSSSYLISLSPSGPFLHAFPSPLPFLQGFRLHPTLFWEVLGGYGQGEVLGIGWKTQSTLEDLNPMHLSPGEWACQGAGVQTP